MPRPYLTIILSFVILLFVSAHVSLAAETTSDSPLQRGKAYFFAKDYEKAYIAFHQAFMESPTDLNVSFFLGRSAFEHGVALRATGDRETATRRFESALMAYDRILIMQPGAIRVKLEMARCHMELGSLEIARQTFHEVLATNPPQAVRDNIDLLLATIAATQKKHYVSGMLSAGFLFDNNVRSGPPAGTPTATFGLLEFQADAPVKDQILSTTLLANHLYRIDETPFSWKSAVTLFGNFYDTYNDLDLTMSGLSTGPVFQTDKFILETHATLNDISLAYDEYVRPVGLGASATYLFDPRFLFTATASLEKKKYAKESDEAKDATFTKIGISPVVILGDNRLTLSAASERENADIAYWSYDLLRWGFRYDRILPEDFTAFASYEGRTQGYDEANTPLTDTAARSDKVRVCSLGLNKIFDLAHYGRTPC